MEFKFRIGLRHHSVLGRGVAFVLVVALTGCVAMVQPLPEPTKPVDPNAEVQEFARLVNRYRQSIGCPVLAWDPGIARVAQEHSAEMAIYNYFSHEDRKGRNSGERLADAGIKWARTAENIAFGQRTAEFVLKDWLASPGHRANIHNCKYTRHGVGLSETRWTHDFVGM